MDRPGDRRIFTRLGRVFALGSMKRAYCMIFRTPAGEHFVLPDLAEFCGAADPAPRNGDSFVQGRAAGRRDVWLHIAGYLNMTEAELFAAFNGRAAFTQGEKNG